MALSAGESFQIDGLSDLEDAFAFLSKAAAAAVLRNVGIDALQPFDAAWRAAAPVLDPAQATPRKKSGALKASGGVGTKLTRSQAHLVKQAGKDFVEVYAGPGPNPQAIFSEFGTRHQRPHPFVRPAWDATKDEVLVRCVAGLQASLDQINQQASVRLAQNAARDLKRNG